MSHHDHEHDLSGLKEDMQDLLDDSSQGIYVFLDDETRFCNEKFAKMLGYESAEAWEKHDTGGQFPMVFVAPESRDALVGTYQTAMEEGAAAKEKIVWLKKGGGTVATDVILTPFDYMGHRLAMHFISASK